MISKIFAALQFDGSRQKRSRQQTVLRWEVLEPRQLLADSAGFVGSYYVSGTPDSTPALVQHEALVDFDWGQRSPLDNTADSDGFSARWESNLLSDHSATHEMIFRLNPDDGLRLWVDNQLAIDAWDGASSEELTANVPLVADQATPLKIEYRDISGGARLWAGWTSSELPKEVIGPEWTRLSSSQQEALDSSSIRGVLFEQLSTIDSDFLSSGNTDYFDIDSGTRISTIGTTADSTTHPGQRTRGFIVPEATGNYQFRISGGDANRLLIADDATPELTRVIASADSVSLPGQWNVDSNQTSEGVGLIAGLHYYFEVRQTDSGSYDGLAVQWKKVQSSGSAWETISNDQLRPVQGEVGVRAVVSAVNETDSSTVLTINVSRDDDFGRALPVDLNFGGTATRNIDYTGQLPTITIPAGRRSASLDITVVNDGIDEALETIEIGVAPSTEYQLTTPVRSRTTLSIFGNLIPAGSSLVAENPLNLASVASINGTSYAAFSNRTASGENGGTINGTVLVVDTTTTPPDATTIWARWDVTQDIPESETLYAEFYYRRLGTAWSQLTFNIRTTSPFGDIGKTDVTAKGFWQRAQIPITPGDPILSSASRVEMFLGSKIAKVEIANFQVKRFINSINDAVAVLPVDAATLANTDIKAGEGTFATFTERTATAAEQLPFDNVLTVDVHTAASFLSQIRAGWYSDFAIDENSTITAVAWLRTDDAPFSVRLRVEQSPAVNRTVLREDLSVTSQWTRHEFLVTARQASQPGEIRLEAIFGRSLGTLEIGGFQLLNQGASPDLTQFLPQEYESYDKRESNKDWRWDAQQSVLENRRHPLQVNVTDLNGNPITGATIEVNQVEHAYGFGNILKTEFISDLAGGQASDPASQRHAAIASRLFNTITIANGIRWVPWDSQRQRGIETVDWVNDNVDNQHGHHLTWGQLSMIPSSVRNEYNQRLNDFGAANAREYLRTAQLDHVADIASELSGTIDGTNLPKITHWDTANHPVLLKEIWNILANGGPIANPIGEVFDTAKANSHPETLQMVNEGQTIEFVDHARRTEYFNLVADLLANGKPVEAVGFMNHFNLNEAPSPTQFNDHLDEFATLGLPLGMTEFDINSTGTDLQTQADWSEDYFLNVFANPATEFIIGYGFYELAHWRHDEGGHWYTADWEAKPNGEVFVDQVHREWQTNTIGSSRDDGTYRTMAFDGRQQVTVTVHGQTYEAFAEVDANGGVVSFQIDVPDAIIESRGVFYNNSSFDGNQSGDNANNDGALAIDKTPLLPGETATFENYTSYLNGINGLFIDIENIANPFTLSSNDFSLATGNGSSSADFSSSSTPYEVSVRADAGLNGSDRVTLTFPDGAFTNTWLQITMIGNDTTGLPVDDVFYFGNAIGETGVDPSNARVNLADVGQTRINQSGFTSAEIDNDFDFNRDGRVNLVDVGIARSNQSGFSSLQLITAPGGSQNRSGDASGGNNRDTTIKSDGLKYRRNGLMLDHSLCTSKIWASSPMANFSSRSDFQLRPAYLEALQFRKRLGYAFANLTNQNLQLNGAIEIQS